MSYRQKQEKKESLEQHRLMMYDEIIIFHGRVRVLDGEQRTKKELSRHSTCFPSSFRPRPRPRPIAIDRSAPATSYQSPTLISFIPLNSQLSTSHRPLIVIMTNKQALVPPPTQDTRLLGGPSSEHNAPPMVGESPPACASTALQLASTHSLTIPHAYINHCLD